MNRSVHVVASLASLLAAAVAALPAAAQDHPNLERGFAAEKAYDFSGVDSVNLFNGQVTWTIPLGPTYKGNGSTSLSFVLVGSSTVWDFQQRTTPQGGSFTQAHPSFSSNAGLGWRLSLGELIPPTYIGNDSEYWVYVAADGSEHTLYPSLHYGTNISAGCYARDGSYLRMRRQNGGQGCSSATTGTTFWIDFPDGSSHKYTRDSAGNNTPPKLREMHDPYGNVTTVTYPTNNRWSISDGIRTHHVDFENRSGSGMKVVKELNLAGFGGTRAIYPFTYVERTISRSCKHDDPQMSSTVQVSLLASVSLPDGGGTWHMDRADSYFNTCYDDEGTFISDLPGVLQWIQLPTRGRVQYAWQLYTYPQRNVQQPETLVLGESVGLRKKWMKEADGSPYDWNPNPWEYTIVRDNPNRLWERKTVVKDPLGNDTVHYFNEKPTRTNGGGTPDGWQYALPFTTLTTNGTSPKRYLSREMFDGSSSNSSNLRRSVFVIYDHSNLPSANTTTSDTWLNSNRRMTSEKVIYSHDDAGRWATTDWSDFDGLGHFRTVTYDGNFARGNDRIERTSYNPGRGTYGEPPYGFVMPPDTGKWILGLYDFTEQTDVENASQTFRQEYDWDFSFTNMSGTGWLQCKRLLRNSGGSRHANDVLVVYDKGPAGNLIKESWYGGDVQNLGTGSTCSAAALPAYQTQYSWSNGAVATSRNYRSGGGAEPHYNFQRDIDANSGLTLREWDPSGYKTVFDYDGLGRMTKAEPMGDGTDDAEKAAKTGYDYITGTNNSPAKVYVTVECPAGVSQGCPAGGVFSQKQYHFDPFGKLGVERVKRDNGNWARRETTWNPYGWKTSQTEWGEDGTGLHKTTYRNFDPFGRPTKIEPPDGTNHNILLDYAGVSQVDRKVKVGTGILGGETLATTTEVYDRHGNLIEVWEPSGPSSEAVHSKYWYDAAHRLRRVEQTFSGNTQVRTFDYDGRGFLTLESHPEKAGNVRYLDYDAKGHAGEIQDGAAGRNLLFAYDASERLTSVREGGAGGRPLKEFFYGTSSGQPAFAKLERAVRHNYIGPPTGSEDYEVTETYDYSGSGLRLTHRTTQLRLGGMALERFEQGWEYDRAGQVTRLEYPNGVGGIFGLGTGGRTVFQTWTNGFQTGVGGVTGTVTYHPNGLTHLIPHANGVTTKTLIDEANDMRRPESIETMGVSGGLDWSAGLYDYDGAGNIKAIGTDRYAYDQASRLRTARLEVPPTAGCPAPCTRTQGYGFDAWGNMTSMTTDGTTVQTPTTWQTNRLTSGTYDAAGNLLEWNGQRYFYDRLNKMQRYCTTWAGGACAGEEWRSVYTPDDERLWFYKLGGPDSVFTVRDLGGKVLNRFESADRWGDYFYLNGQLLAKVERSPGGFGGGEIPAPPVNWTWRHFHLDHLGTPRLVTDAAGARVAEHEYFPFGQEVTPLGEGDVMKFTGHERDLGNPSSPADDLDYMHARHFSALTGRFLGPDAVLGGVFAPKSWNRYCYVRGNPLKYTDPSGNYTTKCTGISEEQCAADVEAFNTERLNALSSEVEGERQAALAYGEPDADNGVLVEFGDPGEGKDGTTTPGLSASADGTGVVGTAHVIIRSGLTGPLLRAQAGHEGSHVQDVQKYAASADPKTHTLDPLLNETRYSRESRAYNLTHRILAASGVSKGFGPGSSIKLGAGVRGPKLQRAIDAIVAAEPYLATPENPGQKLIQ